MKKRRKRGFGDLFQTNFSHACPGCMHKLKYGGFKVIWKDVFECQKCGHVWVVMDLEAASKYL
jgi:hypothetical protein